MTNTPVQPHSPEKDPGREALADALRLSFRMLIIAMLLLSGAYLLSGIFIVQEHQRAYVLLVGRIAGTGADRVKGPGLHWTWPKPFAEIIRVPAERIHNMEIDSLWYAEATGGPRAAQTRASSPALRPGIDGYMLTGDANILHARWAVRYVIRDPELYLFDVADAESLLHRELERAAMITAHQRPVDATLRLDIEGYRASVDERLRERMNRLNIGIALHRLDLLSITPPLQVAAAFDSVIEAEQDRSRAVSAARAYAARARNEAQGERSRIVAVAAAQKQRILSEAAADADFFRAVLEEYRRNPDIIASTLWQNRIRSVLSKVDAQYLVTKREEGVQELRLMIGAPTQN